MLINNIRRKHIDKKNEDEEKEDEEEEEDEGKYEEEDKANIILIRIKGDSLLRL